MTTAATEGAAGAAPAVTVVIPTYDWSAALRCSIGSVLRQTLTDFELLVVGDACTDDSADVVASFGDPRLRWRNLARNHRSQWGPNNHALTVARGEWIAYLGHDDIWHPEHLAVTLAAARRTGAGAAVAVVLMRGPPGSGVVELAGLVPGRVLSQTDFVPPSGLMHRRDLVAEIGPWVDAATISLPTDCEFLQRIGRATTVAVSGQLTVFKFTAAARRDSYRRKSVVEQEEMLRKLDGPGDCRVGELTAALQALADGRAGFLKVPDVTLGKPGAIAEWTRRFRGLEPRFPPDELCAPTSRWEFQMGNQSGGHEWYGEEVDPVHGTFQWTGPATFSTIELPIRFDRRLAIAVRLLPPLERADLDALKVKVNGRPTEHRLVDHADQTVDVTTAGEPFEIEHLQITLELPCVRRPIDLGRSNDRRWLGLPVSRVRTWPTAPS